MEYATIKNWQFEDVRHAYTERDVSIYSLGVGFGYDPMDRAQLKFIDERGIRVPPTMLAVLGHPGSWMADPASGIDYTKLLHGEQRTELVRPLPSKGVVIGRSRVKSVVDKGVGRGVIVVVEREIFEEASGDLVGVSEQTSFCRGDGGLEATDPPPAALVPVPDEEPDAVIDLPTVPQQALFYRFSGDLNPLHIDPDVATKVGFPRPILHGLATYGVAAHAILRERCGYDETRLRSLSARFTSPVFPGETIRTEIWDRDGVTHFRASVSERDVVVLDGGLAEVA